MHNPHDKRFKELFFNKKAFISFLRDCVDEPWTNDITEDDLRKINSSFILQDFSEKGWSRGNSPRCSPMHPKKQMLYTRSI
jgi:hypothetical protein